MSAAPDTPDDDGRRRPSAPLVMFLAVLVVLAVVVAYLSGRSGDDAGDRAGGAGGAGAGTTGAGTGGAGGGSGATPAAAGDCVPGPDLAAPTIDLGVQPSTGSATLLSQRRVDRLVGLAADAGAGVISTSVSWRYLQPTAATAPADFRYAGIDRVIRAASAAGLQVRVQLIGIPRWAADDPDTWTDTTPPTSAAELGRWTEFVSRLAGHLEGRVDYVEVWNEPNGEVYWPGGPDAGQFARLLAASYPAIKAAAPDVEVISGGLVANDIGYLDTLYQAIADLGITPRPFDLLGAHPYTGAAAPEVVDPGRRFERRPFGLVDDNFTGFRALHAVMEERGDTDVDLYITAFGYGTRQRGDRPAVTDAERATYATQALEIVTCTPYVRAFSWYYLHPTPFDPVWWTLLDEQLRPSQTYEAFVTWADQVAASGAPTR